MNYIFLIMRQSNIQKMQQVSIYQNLLEKVDLASLKSEIDKLDIGKLEITPVDLNKLLILPIPVIQLKKLTLTKKCGD